MIRLEARPQVRHCHDEIRPRQDQRELLDEPAPEDRGELAVRLRGQRAGRRANHGLAQQFVCCDRRAEDRALLKDELMLFALRDETGVLRGLAPVTVGLMFAGCMLLMRGFVDWRAWALAGVAFAVFMFTRLHPLWMIGMGAIVGVALHM